jgi:hypothetical protein
MHRNGARRPKHGGGEFGIPVRREGRLVPHQWSRGPVLAVVARGGVLLNTGFDPNDLRLDLQNRIPHALM